MLSSLITSDLNLKKRQTIKWKDKRLPPLCLWRDKVTACWASSENHAAITVQWAQSKSVGPVLLIRAPAISVWVVVLWCKDSKMSGSLVDQVNHVLSVEQWGSAAAGTGWLADCFTANVRSSGRLWLPAMNTETLKDWEKKMSKTATFFFLLPFISDSLTVIDIMCSKPQNIKSASAERALIFPFFSPCGVTKAIGSPIDKNLRDTTEYGNAGQIITILPIWRDPGSDIGLSPRNNWCMQSQIGSPPKIWAHYFIRRSRVRLAKIICVSNTENLNPVSCDNVERFRTISKTVRLSCAKAKATFKCKYKGNAQTSAFFFNVKFICMFVFFAYLMNVRACMI